MVELNHRERTIKVKIVYYGPPIGGKTTNLQVLHQHAQSGRRGEMISINSAQDRTILFDLLPLKAAGFRGFDLKLQLLAVPGQAMYAATRRLVLKGADALVFVANSAADRWEENIQSFREMTQNLLAHQLDPAALPLVLQYNKRDLPEVTPIEFMDRALNARHVDAIQAVAVRGEGVLDTFSAILVRMMQDLSTRYRIVEANRGQTLHQWAQQTILGMFGTTSLATEPNPMPAPQAPAAPRPSASAEPAPTVMAETWSAPPPEPPAPPERRLVRVALPEEAVRMAGAGPDARANETLVESYAQASAQLSTAMEELREERDLARKRLEDIQQALAAAQEVLAGQPLEPVLRTVVGRMAEAAGASHGSFLVVDPDRSLRVAAKLGLNVDPLLRLPLGARIVSDRFLAEIEPRLHQAADSLDLGDALEGSDPPFGAVVAVPVRTPLGMQGMAMIYLTPDDATPRAEALTHLAVISRGLAASLELARALETVRSAEKTLQMALSGTASVRGLQQVVSFLEELRDRQGDMRRKPGAPPWFLEEFARLSPSLSGALSTARSLLAFSRGEVQREAIVVEDLLADLRGASVAVNVGDGVTTVSGDPVLLRLALAALIDHARGGTAVPRDTPIQLRAVADGGRVRLSVIDPFAPAAPGAGRGPGDVSLNLIRRIAELHGGTLTPTPEPGPGFRYTLTLLPG